MAFLAIVDKWPREKVADLHVCASYAVRPRRMHVFACRAVHEPFWTNDPPKRPRCTAAPTVLTALDARTSALLLCWAVRVSHTAPRCWSQVPALSDCVAAVVPS